MRSVMSGSPKRADCSAPGNMKDSPAMRLCAARWRREAKSLTRRRDRARESGDGFEKSRRRTRSSNQLLRRGHDAPGPAQPQAIRAIVWTRKCPVRTPGKIDKPLWAPTFGGPAETKKARSVVASSRVPRLAGFAGSPPAAGLPGAVNWPLVQIPADRHTTTGTCVLGKHHYLGESRAGARVFLLGEHFAGAPAMTGASPTGGMRPLPPAHPCQVRPGHCARQARAALSP